MGSSKKSSGVSVARSVWSSLVIWWFPFLFLTVTFPRADRYRGQFEFTLFSTFGYPLIMPGVLVDTALADHFLFAGSIRDPLRTAAAIVFSATFWTLPFCMGAFVLAALHDRYRRQ